MRDAPGGDSGAGLGPEPAPAPVSASASAPAPAPAQSYLEAYLAGLAPFLDDPGIVEIALNPDGGVFIERLGSSHMEDAGLRLAPLAITRLAKTICADAQLPFSEKAPIVSNTVPYRGQSLRAQVIGPPACRGGTAISLRKYVQASLDLSTIGLLHGQLVDLDRERRAMAAQVKQMISTGRMQDAWQLCINARLNLLVSGGTSTGKTTFARALLSLVDPRERILTIEDAAEIAPGHSNSVQLLCERKEGSARTADLLLQSTLRMRPDRIILGELRGGEARTFLEAINTGHGGSFTTLHAETARRALERLALMVLSTGLNMTYGDVLRYCRQSIDVVVQLGRADGRRGIVEVYLGEDDEMPAEALCALSVESRALVSR